ncbi:MAG: phosphotransferase [Actinomycetota bacterium]|nr:phosphotransferase [Actinomycetota bacterium]
MFQAARLFFGECCLSYLGSSSGYSGSSFASVESSGGRWLLRRWPAGFEAGLLDFAHRSLAESRARGFEGVPRLASTDDGRTILELAGCLYDAQEFLPGRPLSPTRPGEGGPVPNVAVRLSRGRLRGLSEAIARFHRSTRRLAPEPDWEVIPLPQRLGELEAETDRCRATLLDGAQERAGGEERETALRWLELLPRALAAARGASEEPPGGRGGRVLCHGDLWPAHVHFDGDTFVGLVDFESLVFAPPTLDLAQLVGHFGGWGAREVVLDAYSRIAPLGERCRAALPTEVVADLAMEGFWSLRALYGQPPADTTPVQREAHALNLGVLLKCFEEAYQEAKAQG